MVRGSHRIFGICLDSTWKAEMGLVALEDWSGQCGRWWTESPALGTSRLRSLPAGGEDDWLAPKVHVYFCSVSHCSSVPSSLWRHLLALVAQASPALMVLLDKFCPFHCRCWCQSLSCSSFPLWVENLNVCYHQCGLCPRGTLNTFWRRLLGFSKGIVEKWTSMKCTWTWAILFWKNTCGLLKDKAERNAVMLNLALNYRFRRMAMCRVLDLLGLSTILCLFIHIY